MGPIDRIVVHLYAGRCGAAILGAVELMRRAAEKGSLVLGITRLVGRAFFDDFSKTTLL